MTSLQNFWNPDANTVRNPPTAKRTVYLLDLRSVAFIQSKHLDGEHFPILVRGLPNIRESAGRDGMLGCSEGRVDFVRRREEAVYLASPTLFPDTLLVNV